jgi:hypothetical protein
MEKCTRCSKEFTDLKVAVKLNVNSCRLKEDGLWENLPNLNVESKETICKECFDIFAEALGRHMELKK